MLYKVVVTFKSVDGILKCGNSNESYWAALSYMMLFIMLFKVVPTFESVDEILKCDNSNESYWAVLSWHAVCHAVKVVLSFELLGNTSQECCLFLTLKIMENIVARGTVYTEG